MDSEDGWNPDIDEDSIWPKVLNFGKDHPEIDLGVVAFLLFLGRKYSNSNHINDNKNDNNFKSKINQFIISNATGYTYDNYSTILIYML